MKCRDDLINFIKEKGYKNIYIWSDPPKSFYDWHTHSHDEIRIVIEGEMLIKTKEKEYLLKEGDTLEVKRNEPHMAYTEKGVTYICASKD